MSRTIALAQSPQISIRSEFEVKWVAVSNRHPLVVDLYSRHYSARKSKASRETRLRYGISPPGSDLTMLLDTNNALFGWIQQQYRDDLQEGVQCYVFRNESTYLSSDLITAATVNAYEKYGKQRLWTYVDASQVQSKNPGYCFQQAGWMRNGTSRTGLLIFEFEVNQS